MGGRTIRQHFNVFNQSAARKWAHLDSGRNTDYPDRLYLNNDQGDHWSWEPGDDMTKLSPKAWRFVDIALEAMGAQGREATAPLDRDPEAPLSAETAEPVLRALGQLERSLRARLATGRLSEDEVSDLSNDLGFVCAIEQDLSQDLRKRHRA